PMIEPEEGATVLSSPIIIEQVDYRIQGNSIDVCAQHTYKKDAVVNRYYGMQSMFVDEDSIMTPCGKYPTFTSQSSVVSFKKSQFKDFNRYIEHNADGWCQSAWMRPEGLGSHEFISDNSVIFTRGSKKCYHVLLNGSTVYAGQTYKWHGIYTWDLPLVNDAELIAYRGIIDQQKALYIDTKQACERTLTLPDNWKGYYVIESKGEGSIVRNGNSLNINATGPASFIITKSVHGDVNLDKKVDVADVNDTINHILKIKAADFIADLNDDKIVDVADVNELINIILGNPQPA
ncbi:MAG: dockerin type I repeat-containing protein, partial [Muribaculaceae bacterium]|nr:dockerin type I repeat-containing protein [Muribaculaceae bacterium]